MLPTEADVAHIRDFVLDHHGDCAADVDLVALLEYAGRVTGLWRTSEWASLRLAMPV